MRICVHNKHLTRTSFPIVIQYQDSAFLINWPKFGEGGEFLVSIDRNASTLRIKIVLSWLGGLRAVVTG